MIFLPGRAIKERLVGHMARVDAAHAAEEEGCLYCGHTPVCDVCGRCFDPRCNAGCVFCRSFNQPPETCPCCGQEVN